MGVADLWLGPPPGRGEPAGGRQIGRGGADEGIDVVKDVDERSGVPARPGIDRKNSAGLIVSTG